MVETAEDVLFAGFGSDVELVTVAVLVVSEPELKVAAVTLTVTTT